MSKAQDTETGKVEQSLISLASISLPFDMRLAYKANTARSAVMLNVNNGRVRKHCRAFKTLSWTLLCFNLTRIDGAMIIVFS